MRNAIQALVVLFIFANCGGLLFLAIHKVKGQSDLVKCQNNLRQIGITISSFQDSLKNFPSPTLYHETLVPEKRLSWLLAIVPYVEAGYDYALADTTKAWDAEENRKMALMDYRLFSCPATTQTRAPTREYLTYYVGIAGVGSNAAAFPMRHSKAGFFGYYRTKGHLEEMEFGITEKDIKDGKGSTLVALETNLDNGSWIAGGYPTVRGLDPRGPDYLGEGGQFGSGHRGGSNALFADVSVTFLHQSISPRVMEAMATIAGGEEVPELP